MAAQKTFALGMLVWLAASTTAVASDLPNGFFSSGWDANGNAVAPTVNLGILAGASNLSITETTTTTANGVTSVNSANLGPAPTPTPSAPAPSSGTADAFLNFGNSSYVEANALTTGNPQGWFTSPVVEKFYGGVPNAQQRQDFSNAVMNDVQQAYSLSGLNIKLTTDPTVTAAHALSVVSGASYAANANAIGITDVGNSGFSFIDKFGTANSINQLEWAVAHNVTHELMHAFGVAQHDDQTGTYLDSAITPWSLLFDPNARLSPAAVADLQKLNWDTNSNGSTSYGAEMAGPANIDGDQLTGPSPVPEPTTLAFWGLAATALTVRIRTRRRAA